MPRTTTITLGDLHDRAVSEARASGRTLSALVRDALSAYLDPEPSPEVVAAGLIAKLGVQPEVEDGADALYR